MDRFIDLSTTTKNSVILNLKSNMDRFIANFPSLSATTALYLKSNMDRFIAFFNGSKSSRTKLFKIQYGQIYSPSIKSV